MSLSVFAAASRHIGCPCAIDDNGTHHQGILRRVFLDAYGTVHLTLDTGTITVPPNRRAA